MINLRNLLAASLLCSSISAQALELSLSSNDISHGQYMTKAQEFNGFGCGGQDSSPHLAWTNAPKGTKSFAITAYDPDAPTGSGWWHWQVINIPTSTTELPTNAGASADDNKEQLLPEKSRQMINDYGVKAFGGACPPVGHGVHRYRFTVHALSVESLELPEKPSAALVGYMINANTLAISTIEALYRRD